MGASVRVCATLAPARQAGLCSVVDAESVRRPGDRIRVIASRVGHTLRPPPQATIRAEDKASCHELEKDR